MFTVNVLFDVAPMPTGCVSVTFCLTSGGGADWCLIALPSRSLWSDLRVGGAGSGSACGPALFFALDESDRTGSSLCWAADGKGNDGGS